MIAESNDLALLKLSYCPFLSPKKIYQLEKSIDILDEVFYLSHIALMSCGLDEKTVTQFCRWRKNIDTPQILDNLKQESISFITWHSHNYSSLLREIYSPPPVIFYRGNLKEQQLNSKRILSVVGTRECSHYADKVIKEFLPSLIRAGVIIVSGLALGVDSLSHISTLKNKGETWAVLGSGLNRNLLYPSENKKLADEIINNGGLIISELAPSCPATKFSFPRRNRIIAGLAHATLVVEAGKKSGALITANYALQENRDVLTVPGNVFIDTCLGNNHLIKSGASPILSAQDLLNYFNMESEVTINHDDEKFLTLKQLTDKAELLIYKTIDNSFQKGEKIDLEFLSKITKLDTAKINSTLTILELKNIITEKNGFWETCL